MKRATKYPFTNTNEYKHGEQHPEQRDKYDS